MQKTVTIEIDEAGESSIDLAGFQGKGCADVAKAFQGNDAVTRSGKKREFQVEAAQIPQQRQRS
jgi:hypothetical protein